jgi:carbamoyl-phosphate synthase large subunit
VLPSTSLAPPVLERIRAYTGQLAKALRVVGLMNVQYAVKDATVYVLEVNPRASRTVPYVSKATGVAVAKIAVGLMLGKSIADFKTPGGILDVPGVIDAEGVLSVPQFFVKSPVFPFNKFPGVDPTLGPEMRSTGEVMGVGENFGEAFAKAQLSAGTPLPDKGRVFLSVNDRDKLVAVALAKRFTELGFEVTATRGTAAAIRLAGIPVKTIFKVNEGRPNAVDLLKAGSLDLIIYTATSGAHAFSDEKAIRRNAVTYRVPCVTTMSGARASVEAIASRRRDPIRVWNLQEIHSKGGADRKAGAPVA